MIKCPKCNSNGIYYDSSFDGNYNVCVYCGFLHVPHSSYQSMERQITGRNDIYGVGDVKAQLEQSSEIEEYVLSKAANEFLAKTRGTYKPRRRQI